MIIENKYGIVNLNWKDKKKIILNFSGGADSTLLLWLCLKNIKNKQNTVIQVFTDITKKKGTFKRFTSQEIFDIIRLENSDIINNVPDMIITYINNEKEIAKKSIELLNMDMFDLRMTGMTSNPPYHIMKKHNMLIDRIEIRDKNLIKKEWCSENVYKPFINIDKRWIAQCYHDFGLMDKIYPLTTSCERFRNTPDMFYNEEPCKHCWWCREKKMAFGTYDGGVI